MEDCKWASFKGRRTNDIQETSLLPLSRNTYTIQINHHWTKQHAGGSKYVMHMHLAVSKAKNGELHA